MSSIDIHCFFAGLLGLISSFLFLDVFVDGLILRLVLYFEAGGVGASDLGRASGNSVVLSCGYYVVWTTYIQQKRRHVS